MQCCEGTVFKDTLMPMFVKKHHEVLIIVSSFNIGQNQTNSIPWGDWGKKLKEKTGRNPKVSFTK